MIEVKLTFATIDDALAAVSLLAGITTAGVSIDEDAPAKPKKATPAQKAAAATNDGFEEPAAKGKGKKAAKAKAPSVEELKAHIMEVAGDGPDQPAKIKEYVRSFGVSKISDLTEAQRQEAFDGAADYFGEEEGEEDPMA